MRKGLVFALVVVACVAGGGGYVAWAAARTAAETAAPVRAAGAAAPAARVTAGQVLFRNTAEKNAFGKVGIGTERGSRTLSALACDRVYFAGGRGLCLAAKSSFGSLYSALVFDEDFEVVDEVPLSGLPSRARVSRDGRYGASTTFVSGHSYADEGGFSTRTTLYDMRAGKAITDLEKFTVTHNGKRITSPDVNFWGVTFASDSNRFYATVATRGKTYLIEGDIRARRARVLHENVECPSLSPDETRIAYKKLVGTGDDWRFYVLDLKTMRETPLAETRRIDDQAEWLDDDRILYGLGNAVWVMRADGSGKPRKFLANAVSPSVVR